MYTVHVTILFLPSLNSDHFYYVALKNTSHKLQTSFHNPLIDHGPQLEKHSGRDCATSQILFQREDSIVEPGVSKPGLGERDLEKKKKEERRWGGGDSLSPFSSSPARETLTSSAQLLKPKHSYS